MFKIWPKIGPIGIWMGYFFLKSWYLNGSTFKFRGGTYLLKPNLSIPLGPGSGNHAGTSVHSVQRGLKPTLFIFIPPFNQTTLFTKTNIPTLLQIMFCKNKHDANLHNSFEYNHISYYMYSLIAFDERVTFWLQRVQSLPCAYVALFACRPTRITITQSHTHTMQQTHAHKWPGALKPKSYCRVEGIGVKQILWRYQACVTLENFNIVKYINLTQNNNLCIVAQYQNPPFLLFIHPLYTNTLFNSKTYYYTHPFTFFQIFQTHPF